MPPKKMKKVSSSSSPNPRKKSSDEKTGYAMVCTSLSGNSESDSSDTDPEYTPEEPPRLVNDKTARQFHRTIFRYVLVERKFEAPSHTFEETIRFYNWGPLTLAPAILNVEIAREFYANNNASHSIDNNKVYLRGTYLAMTSHSINQHYLLPDYPNDEFGQLVEAGNVDYLLESVTLPGATWVRNAQSEAMYVSSSELTAEARMWLLFINSRLIPIQQTTKTTRQTVLLVYAIQYRLTIDVGRLIMWYINCAQQSKATPILFPFLLSEMAIKQGIEIAETEYCRQSLGVMGK